MAEQTTDPPKERTKEEVFAAYERRLSSKGRTRNFMLRFAREFVDFAEGSYDRETVERFLEYEQKKHGYNAGSLNFAFRIVRTLFGRNEIEWPFNRGEGPTVREGSIDAPALDPRTIRRLVETVRATRNRPASAFLALATTYGLRRQEMINLRPPDIRLTDQTLYIATLKHGRERTHLIPDQIVYHLAKYDFSTPRSESYMYNLWGEMERGVGLHHIGHVGWHSIRRTLDTLLLRVFPETTVSSFLRWKQATSSKMTLRYSRTTFVGEDENVVELSGEALTVDQLIFSQNEDGTYKHPFIGLWE
jgi:integrase